MSLPLTFAISLFLSIALVPFFMRHAVRLGLVDIPDGIRKIHSKVIPRCGGIAIAVAALLPSLYYLEGFHINGLVLLGALIIVLFGFFDDKYDLSYGWKFCGQFLAVIVFLISIETIGKFPFFLSPESWAVLGYVGLFIFMVGATNAVNLSDGLDGLAGGTILLSLTLIAYLASFVEIKQVALIAIALIGALLGFLRYNTHPATVFMGDAGSQFIGYTTAALSVLLTQNVQTALSPVLPLLIMGLPLIDTAMVMTIRISQGRSPFSPDKNHIHHQLLRFGLHHHEAVALIYMIQLVYVILAFVFRFSSDNIILLLYVGYSGALLFALIFLKRIGWHFRAKPEIGHDGQSFVERRNPFLRKFGFLQTYGPMIILFVLGGLWILLVATNAGPDRILSWLAMGILIVSFLVVIIWPKHAVLSTRLTCYGASVLALYPHWRIQASEFSDLATNGFLITIIVVLALSILVTRKENFRLDNQDILMLVLLLGASVLPLTSPAATESSSMTVRLIVMLYAIEFIINSLKSRAPWLHLSGVTVLFAIAFLI